MAKTQYPILKKQEMKNLSSSLLTKLLNLHPSKQRDAFVMWQYYTTALQMSITATKYIKSIEEQIKEIPDFNGANHNWFKSLLKLMNSHREELITANENIEISKDKLNEYGIIV